MIRLDITWNNRKRFVISAAMAALLVLLAGGANALAQPTVRCVPSLNVNPSCTVAYSTIPMIGNAVAAAAPGDIILVGPGKYNESVTITQPLSLFGAQAGHDARGDRHDSLKESIVDATGTSGPAFFVDLPSNSYAPVVIDGFTIQGGAGGTYGSGIYVYYYYAAPVQIVNNIIQNNAVGVYLYETYTTLIEHNLFKTNNVGAAGSGDYGVAGTVGYGIATYYPYGLAITENEFHGNTTTAMYAYESEYYGTTITGNTSENDGSFVILYYCYYVQFSHNRGKNFGAHATLLPGSVQPDAAIDIGYYNYGLEISDNDLEEGKAPISNGIAITNIFGSYYGCYTCNVNNNRIRRFPSNGIVAEDGYGTLYDSVISGNEVEDNGQDGILIAGPASNYNYANLLFGNKAAGNHTNDCEDDTIGSGTLGTGNTWFNNIGSSSYPVGLCTPGGIH
jgi:parallel beta-helix repeat protein